MTRGRLAGLRRVSIKDDELVDDKRAVGAKGVPGGGGVRRRDQARFVGVDNALSAVSGA